MADHGVPWTYGEPIDAGFPEPTPRALVALSEDRLSLVLLVPSKGDDAQWWSICHWDYETDRMEPMYRMVDKGQDASEVLAWYESELSQTKNILRDALRQVLEKQREQHTATGDSER